MIYKIKQTTECRRDSAARRQQGGSLGGTEGDGETGLVVSAGAVAEGAEGEGEVVADLAFGVAVDRVCQSVAQVDRGGGGTAGVKGKDASVQTGDGQLGVKLNGRA